MKKSNKPSIRDTVLVVNRASKYFNQTGQMVGTERKYRSGSGWYDAANVKFGDGSKHWFAYSSIEKFDPAQCNVPGTKTENANFALIIQNRDGLNIVSTYADKDSLEIAGRALRMQIQDRNQRVFVAEIKGEFKLREPLIDFEPAGN